MPVTRSSTRSALKQPPKTIHVSSPVSKKEKAHQSQSRNQKVQPIDREVTVPFVIPPRVQEPTFIPAALTFSIQDAKEHLEILDSRFGDVFRRLPCGPYEKLEAVDPFRYALYFLLYLIRS